MSLFYVLSIIILAFQSLEDLVKVVCSLEDDIIKKRPGIRLVVVDSIAYHFRYLDDVVKVSVIDVYGNSNYFLIWLSNIN